MASNSGDGRPTGGKQTRGAAGMEPGAAAPGEPMTGSGDGHGAPPDDIMFRDFALKPADIETRKIGLDDLLASLGAGYRDFTAKPASAVPFLALYYPLMALIFVLFAFGQDVRYLAFPVVAGFTLIGPVVAIGFFSMSRRRERGLDLRWGSAFNFVHSYHFAPILALALLMMLLYVAWLYMAELIFFNFFTDTSLASIGGFIDEVLGTRRGHALIAYGNFVGLLFALATLALSIVAFPLALDKPVTARTAVAVSARAFFENTLMLALWGLMVVAILLVGAALFLVGLAIALPVLGHATWHLYRKLVVD